MSTRSSTPIPFPIRSARDLLAKGKRELDRLNEAVSGAWGQPNPIDAAAAETG